MKDEDFQPKLGRMRAKGSKRGARYLHRVLAATALAGGLRRQVHRRFDGSRIGRGAAMGRILRSRDRLSGLRSRRAIVKTRLVRLGGKGSAAARAHLRYIQRDGVTREGAPGRLYSAETDDADGKAFLDRSEGDRHQFRFIVSAEDGAAYDDLKPLVRRVMAKMELDLGTGLDWVAVDHLDTFHPHTHIVLRGKDERGENLVIARDYISRGLRERVAEQVSLDLGPRTDLEIEGRLRWEVGAERFTSIDRRLLRDMDEQRRVTAGGRTMFDHALRAGRLRKLESLGFASGDGSGRWILNEELEQALRSMGERGDIMRTMQRELTGRGVERAAADRIVHIAALPEGRPVVGRLVARGLSDETRDRHYLIVDGIDGRVHYLDAGRGNATEPLPVGAIIRVSARSIEVRAVDRTVAEIAAENGARYSEALHRDREPKADPEFVRAHVRGSKRSGERWAGPSGGRTEAGPSRRTISSGRRRSNRVGSAMCRCGSSSCRA